MTGSRVRLCGSRRGVDSAWIENDGRLIAEWYEPSDTDDGALYDHADTITFDTDGKTVLAKAMDIPPSDDRLLAEIQKRFRNLIEVRQFAEENRVPFTNEFEFTSQTSSRPGA